MLHILLWWLFFYSFIAGRMNSDDAWATECSRANACEEWFEKIKRHSPTRDNIHTHTHTSISKPSGRNALLVRYVYARHSRLNNIKMTMVRRPNNTHDNGGSRILLAVCEMQQLPAGRLCVDRVKQNHAD